MNDADLAIVLAATFALGCAAVLGLRRRREAAIRALSVVTLCFGLFLTLVAISRAPGRAGHGSGDRVIASRTAAH